MGGGGGGGAFTPATGLYIALSVSGGQRPGGPAALVLAGFHGWGANRGSSGRASKTHGDSYRGLGWSAGPPGRMGKGFGDAANWTAALQSGTQSCGAGI